MQDRKTIETDDIRIDRVTVNLAFDDGDRVREVTTLNRDFEVEVQYVPSGMYKDDRELRVTFVDDELNEIMQAGREALGYE